MKRASFVATSLSVLAPISVRAQQQPTIRIGALAQEGVKTLYYAQKTGMFRDAGLNVEVTVMPSGAAALAAVTGGALDVAYTSLLAIFQGVSRGVPFQIVAPGQLNLAEVMTAGLFCKKTATFQRGSDLEGKTVAVPSVKDLNWAGTCAWTDANGGDSRLVKFVELPPSSTIAALSEGRIDVGSLSPPYVQQALSSPDLRLLGKYFDAIGKRFEAAVWASYKPYVTANRDAVTRFARVMQTAGRYVNAHQSEMIDLIAGFTKVDPSIVAKANRSVEAEYVDPRDIQPVLDVTLKYKLIDNPITVDDCIAPTALRPPGRR